MAKHVRDKVHGLPLEPTPEEEAHPAFQMFEDVKALYAEHKTPEQSLVGYKRGTIE